MTMSRFLQRPETKVTGLKPALLVLHQSVVIYWQVESILGPFVIIIIVEFSFIETTNIPSVTDAEGFTKSMLSNHVTPMFTYYVHT